MCACEPGFTCAKCRGRWPLDIDPYHQDPSEQQQERREELISRPDFERPA